MEIREYRRGSYEVPQPSNMCGWKQEYPNPDLPRVTLREVHIQEGDICHQVIGRRGLTLIIDQLSGIAIIRRVLKKNIIRDYRVPAHSIGILYTTQTS